MTKRQNDFRKWIEAGFRDYGRDPWFFIRELAQNSRDAGARTIHVKIGYTAKKEEALVFQDDGIGMTFDDAEKYLFRLYASSKTGEKYAAGMFGIGFWTVLKFNPSSIIIESLGRKQKKSKNNRKWGVKVVVADELETIPFNSTLSEPGTRITLVRPAVEGSEKEFFDHTGDALKRYCSYLRSNNRRSGPLPVYFGGEDITRPMELPGPVSLSFKNGDVEGAVGLAPQPEVRLYARGLPVWRGTTLQELSHEPPKNTKTREFGEGLAPVFLLNGNRLEVNMSRRKVIDNSNLRHLRKSAEKALLRMVESASDLVSPRSILQRLMDRLKKGSSRLFQSISKTVLLLVLILVPLEIFLMKTFYKPEPSPANIRNEPVTGLLIPADKPVYTGASVKDNTPVENPGLVYSPPGDQWFKVFYADYYSLSHGFRQSALSGSAAPVAAPETMSGETIIIGFHIHSLRPVFLPQPVGYSIHPNSVTLAGSPVSSEALNRRSGGEIVFTPPRSGELRYICYKLPGNNPGRTRPDLVLSADRLSEFTRLPQEAHLPPALKDSLHASDNDRHTVVQKVNRAIALTASLLSYDDSLETAKKYDTLVSNQRDWINRVIQIGAGDCDIINGMTVLLLRKMGVPARLVIGMVGRRGSILPLLHAWTEYYDRQGKHWIIDASSLVSRLDNRQLSRSSPSPPSLPSSLAMDRQWIQPGIVSGTAAHSAPDTGSAGAGLPQRPGPAARQQGQSAIPRPLILYALGGLTMVLLIVLIFLVSREIKKRPTLSPEILRRVERDLAGMALHALLHPNQVHNEGIRDLKLIPTLNRSPISIREALTLSSEQKLFTAAAEDPVFAFLESTSRSISIPLLDAGNRAFAPLIKLLPGAVHLEKIAEFKPVDPEKVEHSLQCELISRTNHFFRELGVPVPPCWLAKGTMREGFFDVDLSPLPRLPRHLLPNRCIIVNPLSSRMTALTALYRKNPPLALLRFIQWLLKTSRLAPVPVQPLLRMVSQKLLKEAAKEQMS